MSWELAAVGAGLGLGLGLGLGISFALKVARPAPAVQQIAQPVEAKPVEAAVDKPAEPVIDPQALEFFQHIAQAWVQNFEQQGPQPDRLALMQQMGAGRWTVAILKLAYKAEGLQLLLRQVLVKPETMAEADWMDYVNRVAGTMVQVSHMGFPDLAGTLDLSKAWERTWKRTNVH